MNTNPPPPPGPSHGKRPAGAVAARTVKRFLKLLGAAVLGTALFFAGLVWLISGIVGHHPISIAAGAMALGVLIFVVARTVRQSAREARALASMAAAKTVVGVLTCMRCKLDFDEAAAPTSPQPWYALPLAVALSLIPIGFGGVVLYGLWFMDVMPLNRPERAMNSFYAVFILVVGVSALWYSVQGRNRRVVRCPSCGRRCGTTSPAEPRGFSVLPE